MSNTRRTTTARIELVETGNIAISLMRIKNAPNADSDSVKRALYHAITMSYAIMGWDDREKLRIALHLP